MEKHLDGDIVVGDLNANPDRVNKWHRVLTKFAEAKGLTLGKPTGDWSYLGTNGTTSKVDHVLVRPQHTIETAEYVREGIAPAFTDHAALFVEISPSVSAPDV